MLLAWSVLSAFDRAFCAEEGDELDEIDKQIDDQADADETGGGRLDGMIREMEIGQPWDRCSAIWRAHSQTHSKRISDKLIEILQKGEPQYAALAAVSLGEIGAGRAVGPLKAALRHESEYVREAAAYALGLIADRAALEDLEKTLPKEPGLSRWIYQDAIARINHRPPSPSPHRRTLEGAGVFYIGAAGPTLRASWRDLISRYELRVDGAAPGPINDVMRYFGGAPDLRALYPLFLDKPEPGAPGTGSPTGGRGETPQLDVILLANTLPNELAPELRWKLFQFVRRGGTLILLGNAMFLRGELRSVTGRVMVEYGSPEELWHSAMPQTLDNEFRPFLANLSGDFRSSLLSGVRSFGCGKTILLATAPDHQAKCSLDDLRRPRHRAASAARGWGQNEIEPRHYENLLLYAFGGEDAFPVLTDLYAGPSKTIVAGNPAAFFLNLFAAGGESGTLAAEAALEGQVVARQSLQVSVKRGRPLPVKVELPLPWTLRDGQYQCRLTFATPRAKSESRWDFTVASPLRLKWEIENSYEEPGSTLAGSAEVENQRTEAVKHARLVLEVSDSRRRTLQRFSRPVEIDPGRNGPFPLRVHARDYKIDSYYLTLRLVQESPGQQPRTLQSSEQFLFRCGPYRFQQDLVYVPWNSEVRPSEERMKRLMVDSGFNGIWGIEPLPGWYNWGVFGPGVACAATWPGELVENQRNVCGMNMSTFGLHLRRKLPGYTIVDHWDESPVAITSSERGEDLGPTTSVLYRNWLKSRYFSLSALNDAWRKDYRAFAMPKTRIPPPRQWEGDLTSWRQVWAWRGSPADWGRYADGYWTEILEQCHAEFNKYNRWHPWHWYDVYHTRIYVGQRPPHLNWESHESRATFGNRPETIMYHFISGDKREEAVRRFAWDGLAGGGRHFITWNVDLNQGGGGLDANWTIWNADATLKPYGKVLADSILRVRAKEQVLVDGLNALSREVAFLYLDPPPGQPAEGSVQALFDALLFAGIHPESLRPGVLRSERMPLDSFRVIFVCRSRNIPDNWRKRLDEWQQKGGKLLYADDFKFAYKADRIESPGFSEYQARLMATLRRHGVTPPVQIVDDNGLPEPAVEPVLLETQDRSQHYLLAAPDWDIIHSQSFGDLGNENSPAKRELTKGLTDGAALTLAERGRYRTWVQVRAQAPFSARLTIDGKGGLPLAAGTETEPLLWAERGLGKVQWVAGPAFDLEAGEHKLKIEPKDGKPELLRALVVSGSDIRPTLLVNLSGVKEVYDVYNERMLARTRAGWRLVLRASYGEVYSLITEDLRNIEVEPRLLVDEADRRLQVKITIRRADGHPSECRHALDIRVRDAQRKPIEGLFLKTSVRGWRVVTLYPAHEDPELPWTVEVEDLTSGRKGEARVAAPAPREFDVLEPAEPLILRTEPLPPLEEDVHLVPFRASVINNQPVTVRGQLKFEIEPRLLLEGEAATKIEVGPKSTKTVQWPVVLGRARAIDLMKAPPRVWLELDGGRVLETEFGDVWIRAWEKTPPLVTNREPGTVTVKLQNFLDRKFEGNLEMEFSKTWEIVERPAATLTIPAAVATDGRSVQPGEGVVRFTARLKDFADQEPEVYRMPLRLVAGRRSFDAGWRLVEVEKHRDWYTAQPPLEMAGLTKEFEPEVPEGAADAKVAKLWGLDWKPFESDTLIDFPSEIGRAVFGVTNVCFPQAGPVSVQVRGEKVEVWLAGVRMRTGALPPAELAPKKEGVPAKDGEDEPAELRGEASVQVEAGRWLPLVVCYHRQSPFPNTDLTFLDRNGRVIWSAEFRAAR